LCSAFSTWVFGWNGYPGSARNACKADWAWWLVSCADTRWLSVVE
jgi:hypothetical protein